MAGPLSYNGAQFLYSGLAGAGQAIGSGIGSGLQQGMTRKMDQDSLKGFVDYIRQYLGNGGAPAGTVTTPFASYSSPGAVPTYDMATLPPIEGFQSGGYTGPGAPDEPAGIVHRNEYVVPSDQVQDAGGPQMIEALLSGLSRNPRAASAPGFAGIANLAQMWEKRKEEEKAIGTTGKALKQIFKSNPDLLQGAGLMPEQLDNLGHRDVIGLFEGMQQAQTMQAKAAGMKELAARLLQQQQAAAQQQAISQDFARFATALPDAEATAPELGDYYDSTSGEMPNRPNVLPQATARTAARHPMAPQHNNFNDYVKLLAPPSASEKWALQPGQIVNYGGRRGLATSPNSVQLEGDEKDKKNADNYPWLLSDNNDEVLAGLREIKDPAERDRAIAARIAVNRMLGKNDPIMDLLRQAMGGKPAESPKKKDAPPKSGATHRYVPGKGLQPIE